ncbi:hypothetical protein KR084_012734, partial [Drosophila pseudotakahashii]
FHFPIGFQISSTVANERVSVNRDYGQMTTKGSATPYPQKTKVIDEMALVAKLESDSLSRSERSSTSSVESKDLKFSQFKSVNILPTGLTFQMQRKLFDEGEFTVCKGRKMSEVYHRIDEDLEDISPPLQPRNTQYSNYKQLKDYCEVNNIRFSQGFGA